MVATSVWLVSYANSQYTVSPLKSQHSATSSSNVLWRATRPPPTRLLPQLSAAACWWPNVCASGPQKRNSAPSASGLPAALCAHAKRTWVPSLLALAIRCVKVIEGSNQASWPQRCRAACRAVATLMLRSRSTMPLWTAPGSPGFSSGLIAIRIGLAPLASCSARTWDELRLEFADGRVDAELCRRHREVDDLLRDGVKDQLLGAHGD